ncbi:alpha/beta hydrolase [Streptomyces sp. H27-D2]|uniref:alpha/beta hydrolase n=1 Tax=Streptomyces sp. H27-D2 TaxID=3046304 RepID=UPI002DB8E0D5|nr:alpha/beta hydrolase [Streptomyces sp. H27-D2]MEC4018739.1 alpha/beta hydrolase [Streptomyces sp. H27-D2]
MTATYIFVHGANTNGLTWAPVQRELALLGQRALAVDLPGHGYEASFAPSYQAPQDLAAFAAAPARLADVTLDDYVERVVGIVRRAAEHGPVVLVGHSLGGLTLTGVGAAVPELIDRIVYIAAWCCVDATAGEYARSPEFASSLVPAAGAAAVGDPADLGVIRLNWRTADPALLAVFKEMMLAEGTEQEFLSFLNTLEPDESLRVSSTETRVDAATWGRIPRAYIRLTADRSIPVQLQDRFIKEADLLTPDNPFEVHSLDSSHVGFMIRGDALAAILAGPAGPAVR